MTDAQEATLFKSLNGYAKQLEPALIAPEAQRMYGELMALIVALESQRINKDNGKT